MYSVVDSLQLGDKHKVTTPVNWKKGEDVIVHPAVNNEEAKKLFPEVTFHKVSATIRFSFPHQLNYVLSATILEDNTLQGLKSVD